MSESNAGLLPGYETTFITRPEMSDDALKTLRERIERIVGTFGGEVVQHDDWGKRKLAYTIKKETRGHYTYLAFTGKPGVIQEIERNLRIHEHVLRFLSVNLTKEFDKEKFNKDFVPFAKRQRREIASDREGGFGRGGFGRGGFGYDDDRGYRDRDFEE